MELGIDKNLLRLAVEKWGKDGQIGKIQEEAMELALILHQRKCATKAQELPSLDAKMYSELADILIVSQYIPLLFDMDKVRECIRYKMHRMQAKHFPHYKPTQNDNTGSR